MPSFTLKALSVVIAVCIGLAAIAPAANAFNPQPEPPKTKSRIGSKINEKGFNPQPEPPKIKNGLKKKIRIGVAR